LYSYVLNEGICGGLDMSNKGRREKYVIFSAEKTDGRKWLLVDRGKYQSTF
jgi:hypothetical protein